MSRVTMRQLLEVGVHFGHQTRFWCPKMEPYIYGHRSRIHVINLEHTVRMFNEAMDYLESAAARGQVVMFVGTKSQAGTIVREQAQRANCPYVYHRWLGGMLTNYTTVRKSIDRLNELDEIINSGEVAKLVKKEALRIQREQFKLDRNLAGIRNMDGRPDILFVIDVKYESNAVKEANKLGIPVVGIVDTNCNPDGIEYVIPGNDDAISAIRLYCTHAADAVISGQTLAASQNLYSESYELDSTMAPEDLSMLNVTGARAAVAPSLRSTEEESTAAAPPETASNP